MRLSRRPQERVFDSQARPPINLAGRLVHDEPLRGRPVDWACADCAGTGDLPVTEASGPICLSCTDMGHLVFLPAGQAS